ncbi:hypothetical protein [Sphingomonas hankookensis]|uniref:hypothetical protein n=1 Tax=Sphingomonas hankookensis TaxID=563996 RepID=UPI003D3024ED
MTTETAHWSTGPLHAALVSCLPTFVKEPFSPAPKLNIPELKVAVGMSHEAVYGWLRRNRLNPRNAQKLVDLANTDANVAALRRLGRKAPKIEDFNRFVFA